MGDYCIGTGDQDLENANRTATSYIYSGAWDPSLNNTSASPGTIFMGTGPDPLVAGRIWQKQDQGCTMNWKELAKASNSGLADIPTTNKLYVDKNRSDSYTETGTIATPFKTIQAAIDAVAAKGDNSNLNPYLIDIIGGGIYAENLVIEDLAIKFLFIKASSFEEVQIQPAAGKSLQSEANNENIYGLIFENILFATDVSIFSPTTGQAIGQAGGALRFIRCTFPGATKSFTIKNVFVFTMYECNLAFNSTFENVTIATISNGDGQSPSTTLNVITNGANPKPAGFSFTPVIFEGVIAPGNCTLTGAGTLLMHRNGCRVGAAGQTITVNTGCTLQGFTSWYRGNIHVLSGGTFQNNGSFYIPTSLTVDAGGTLSNNTYSKVLRYDAVGANWTAPSPTNPQDAIDRLAAAVAGLLGGTIP